MMGILSTMGEFEKSLIKERQLEGIKIRKQKGLYGGRLEPLSTPMISFRKRNPKKSRNTSSKDTPTTKSLKSSNVPHQPFKR
jgi:DNA invertase Pin-like site-specific DNA recombinase